LFALVIAQPLKGCGPYYPIIPTPKFFASEKRTDGNNDTERIENLRLWQRLTSADIPLEDIEDAVYHDNSKKTYQAMFWNNHQSRNRFYAYIKATEDYEISDFLILAKKLEEKRAKLCSPWYYPSSREQIEKTDDLDILIKKFKSYSGKRLRDRYALQTVRALFTSRQYGECIKYYDSAFAEFQKSNIFKKMAMNYVAGCWTRLGETDKANKYFAQTGDLWSLRMKEPIAYMAHINPDSPDLLDYLQTCASGSSKLCSLETIAKKVLKSRKVKCRGDWYFALAYIAGEYHHDYTTASRHIQKGLHNLFSSQDLREHAIAYRIKCDAANGVTTNLFSDMQWFERKVSPFEPNFKEWNRMLQNITYVHLVPNLWRKGNYTTAILLCGYADNLLRSQQRYSHYFYDDGFGFDCDVPESVTLSEMRNRENMFNYNDYSNLSFQLMGSLKSNQLIRTFHQINTNTPLFSLLKKYARTDKDYIYELIGTLALREENYKLAITYLSKVSEKYVKTMNIYKYEYFNRNPFYAYTSHYRKKEEYEDDVCIPDQARLAKPYTKLMFARQMYLYQKQKFYGKNNDERGLARLMYAIGRRNSFEECWALTQYWRGHWEGKGVALFEPFLYYGDNYLSAYDFLYDYDHYADHNKTEKLYRQECKTAMATIQSPEIKANAEYYILRNLRTVIKRYPQTSVAKKIRSSCDRWRNWL